MPEINDGTENTANAGNTEKTLSESEVNRIVQERLAREREKFADYEDLKSKADKLTELEAANQSELEKAQAKAEQAEARAKKLEDDLKQERLTELRSRVARDKGVPEKRLKYVTGETQEEIEASAVDLAEEAAEESSQQVRQQSYVPTAGTGGSAPDHEGAAAERAKAWLGRK